MDGIIHTIGEALRTLATWEFNGLLALLYTAWEHLAALVTAAAFAGLLWWTPPGRRSAQPGREAFTDVNRKVEPTFGSIHGQTVVADREYSGITIRAHLSQRSVSVWASDNVPASCDKPR
jgi:hypothetical protein